MKRHRLRRIRPWPWWWWANAMMLVVAVAGCQAPDNLGRPAAMTLPVEGDAPLRINDVQVIGSHNSYKEFMSPEVFAAVAAVNERQALALEYHHLPLPEQLEMGLRKFEIDFLHDPVGGRFAEPLGPSLAADRGTPESQPFTLPPEIMNEPGLKVIHMQDIDYRSNCLTLVSCLQAIKSWSDANRWHLPVMVQFNAKTGNVDFEGSVAALPFDSEALDTIDEEILQVYPRNRIITPDSVRGMSPTLEQAVRAGRWPTLDEARGKILFVLDEGGDKMATYIDGHPSLQGRVMFTNSPEGTPEAAFRVVNDPVENGDYIRRLVEQGYLVRTRADANTTEARTGDTRRREAAFASGAQFISTDYYLANPTFGTGYSVSFGSGRFVRCNPVRTGTACVDEALE